MTIKDYDHAYRKLADDKPLANWQAALMFIVFFGVISTPIFILGG